MSTVNTKDYYLHLISFSGSSGASLSLRISSPKWSGIFGYLNKCFYKIIFHKLSRRFLARHQINVSTVSFYAFDLLLWNNVCDNTHLSWVQHRNSIAYIGTGNKTFRSAQYCILKRKNKYCFFL